jgi:hypothetical protein
MSLYDIGGSDQYDPSLYDSSASSSDTYGFSTTDGVTDGSVGSGYDWATGTDSIPPSATSQTSGQLQAGGSNINWNGILQGGLSALVAADSINHGLTATGQALPVYKAPNGYVYPVGQGPMMGPTQGGGFMLFLLLGVILFAIAEDKK